MIYLFTHTDLDGIGCAILATLAFGKQNVTVTYCNIGEIDEAVSQFTKTKLQPEDMCHITDISVDDSIAAHIDNNQTQYYLFDHHATALNLNKYDWCQVQTEDPVTKIKTSGTEIYYQWLLDNGYLTVEEDVIRRFVETVRDYDTWRWSTLGENGLICKQLNDLFYLYGTSEFIEWTINQIDTDTFPTLSDVDQLVLSIKQKEIDDYVTKKNEKLIISTVCDYTCGVVFADRYQNELGNRLCEMHPEIDFIAIANMDGNISYRTIRDDIDLGGDIAKTFGGGGHPKAAGSQLSQITIESVINLLFKQ